MSMLGIVAVTGLVVVVLLGLGLAIFLVSRSRPSPEPVGSGQWRATHYEAKGVTRVVVQKTSTSGVNLLDEHVVAELHRDEPDFDARFLEAMSTARQRESVFRAEQG